MGYRLRRAHREQAEGAEVVTRWKRESLVTLLLMHEHNQWSRWNQALLEAAEEFGLLVGFARYGNCSSDGSTDREWYVLGAQLERIDGGLGAVKERAEAIHERQWKAIQT